MLMCEQTKGQSVYEHGVSVEEYFFDLYYHLKDDCELKKEWKLPDWLNSNKQEILSNLHSLETISTYLRFHDCGKPKVKTVDEFGKVHFPGHAEASKELYFQITGDKTVSDLIGWDMCLHTCSSAEIDAMCKVWTKQDAYTLVLASLSEIHSNARLFGGISSISFKTKFKQIDRRGKQILRYFSCCRG